MGLRTQLYGLSYVLLGIVVFFSSINFANAHTTSLGYVPGANPGEVTFWTGSYNHGGTPVNEGTATLTGVDVVYNQVVNFNIAPVNAKPAGLVDGTNNFFWGPFPYPFPVNTDPVLFGGVVWWQGVTFTGLSPGTYDFTCGGTCGTTAQWVSLTAAGGSGGTVRITLTAGSIGGGTVGAIPTLSQWAMWVMAFLLGLWGMVMLHKRKLS